MDKFITKYGNPFLNGEVSKLWQKKFEAMFMQVYKYPLDIRMAFPTIGETVYMNKDFIPLYQKFLRKLIDNNLQCEVTVNDQCFMPRYIRGTIDKPSIHSWGMAVDLNPLNNPLGVTREQAIKKGLTPFTKEFQETAKVCGIVCGYDFSRCDGMHFEHSNWS